jgi:hypothetical protein
MGLPLVIPYFSFFHWFSSDGHGLLITIFGTMGAAMIGVLVSAQVVLIMADI